MADWKACTLGDLVTFQRGHDLPKSQVVSGPYPIAGSNGIIGYHKEFTTKAPSITIGRSGNIGNPYFYERDFWAHNTTLFVKEFKGNDPLFVYYLLKTMDFSGHNSGSAVPSLNRNFIHPIKVSVPESIEEQKAIAKILLSLDEKIELNQRMNTTLEAMGRALFKAWFLDFEPVHANMVNRPSISASPEIAKTFSSDFVDSEIGPTPNHWCVQSIFDSAKFINGRAFKQDEFSNEKQGLPVIKIAELKNGVSSQTQFTQNQFDSVYRVSNGDILFSWSGSPETSIDTFVWIGSDGWLNQHIFKVYPKRDQEREFVYFLLREFKEVFINIAKNKQTTGLGHVTGQDLRRLKFVKPPDEILRSYSEHTSPIFNLIISNKKEVELLKKYRDELLPRLISGKIRVCNE